MPKLAPNEATPARPDRRCPSTALLTIEGRSAGVIRCGRVAEHRGSHRLDFDVAWQDDLAPDWPEAHDPDEDFDVEVDALSPLIAEWSRRDVAAIGDGATLRDRLPRFGRGA